MIDAPQSDREMMQSPEDWPRWPMLPVKKVPTTGSSDLGFMLAVEGHLTTVFLVNLYELSGCKTIREVIDYAGDRKKVYLDYEGITDDGWVVD